MGKRLLTIVFSIVFVWLVSWSIYDFIFSSNKTDENQVVSDDFDQAESETETNNDENVLGIEQETLTMKNIVGLEIGNTAPDFKLATLDGGEAALSDYLGSPVMLNFWATWCPPCRAEMPDMEKFYQDTEVEVLAINLLEAERTIDDVDQFVDEYELTFPILLDEFIEVAMTYEIQPIPTTFMIDSEGIIQFKSIGPLTYDQMVEVLDNIN